MSPILTFKINLPIKILPTQKVTQVLDPLINSKSLDSISCKFGERKEDYHSSLLTKTPNHFFNKRLVEKIPTRTQLLTE